MKSEEAPIFIFKTQRNSLMLCVEMCTFSQDSLCDKNTHAYNPEKFISDEIVCALMTEKLI